MSANNIFQVLNHSHLDEILKDHLTNIVVIMYSTKTCQPCLSIKPTFIQASRDNPNIFFVYIDTNNFQDTLDKKYTENIKMVPHFSFYYSNKRVVDFKGPNKTLFLTEVAKLKKNLESQIQKVKNQYSEQDKIKLDLLNKIHGVENTYGIKISKYYDINSTIEELNSEHNLQLKKLRQIQDEKQNNDVKNELLQRIHQLEHMGYKASKFFTLKDSLDDIKLEYHKLLLKFQQENNIIPEKKNDPIETKKEIIDNKTEQITPNETHGTTINTLNVKTITKDIPIQELTEEQKIILEKKKYIDEITEIALLGNEIQMKKLYNIDNLKKVQQYKEREEKRNGEYN